ncbi:hypothetical protein KAI87_04220 [Myxococcota bacterium]|nr:hypothetical protein [Myxococcota bacterium]
MNSRTIFALIATLSLGFAVACGSDDDDAAVKDTGDTTGDTTGTYTGNIDMALCGNDVLEGNEWCDGTGYFLTSDGNAPVCSETDSTTMPCTSGCLWDTSVCVNTDYCDTMNWYNDNYCDACEIMGGTEDPDCASCGDGTAAGTTYDEYLASGNLYEMCDTNDVHGASCADWGYTSGEFSCDERCQIDSSDCVE